jgi:hypothetical protein
MTGLAAFWDLQQIASFSMQQEMEYTDISPDDTGLVTSGSRYRLEFIHPPLRLLPFLLFSSDSHDVTSRKTKNTEQTSPPNPVPSALLAFRLRSRLGCQKQAGCGDWGRSIRI